MCHVVIWSLELEVQRRAITVQMFNAPASSEKIITKLTAHIFRYFVLNRSIPIRGSAEAFPVEHSRNPHLRIRWFARQRLSTGRWGRRVDREPV
uniref:Uncharacterized protein n=1 Tax=Romanomermis culicivorax TaxID=13658 RepID=A0A915K9W3_ROMCU